MDVAHVKTDEEYEAEFAELHEEEVTRQGKLNETIFSMGEMLNRWQPDQAMLGKLARQYGYKVKTLEARMIAARELPTEVRNPRLAYTSHLEVLKIAIPNDDQPDLAERIDAAQAARRELIEGNEDITANQMRVKVDRKRVELGQIRPRDPHGRTRAPALFNPLETKIANTGHKNGHDVSDKINLVQVRQEINGGKSKITVDCLRADGPVGFEVEPEVTMIRGETGSFVVTFTLANGHQRDEEDAVAEAIEA